MGSHSNLLASEGRPGAPGTWRVGGTYRRGELVFDGMSVFAGPGSGRFIRPFHTKE